MPQSHQLRWSHGEATIVSTAATVTDASFLVGGKPFKPFARAPWVGKVDDPSIIGHLRVLSGDFVGIPFGTGRPMPDAPAEWARLMVHPPLHPIHGPAADRDWTIVAGDDGAVTLTLAYDENSPVEKLERVIAARNGSPALDFLLRVHARRKADISLGLHPNFRLPEQPGRLELRADFAFGLTHPGQTGSGPMEFSSLAAVPRNGTIVDMSHIPLSPRTDKNVQLCGMRGPLVAAWLDEGMSIELDWDRSLLQSLMIWYTDGGIGGEPWNHQFRAVGLEPIASAFDLHTDTSAGPNPIKARGVKTSVALDPDKPLEVWHSIRAFAA